MDNLWRLPPRGGFSENQLREESSKHHKAIFDGVSQISLILGIKISARGFRESLGTLFKWTTPELKKVSGLKLSSWHWLIVLTKEHLLHLNSAKFRASVLDKLVHFIWTHPLQRLQFIQSINPEGFKYFKTLQVSLFFITTQPRNLTNCRNTTIGCVPVSPKKITTVKQSVYRTKPWIDKMKY